MYFQPKGVKDSDLSSFVISHEFATSFNKHLGSVSLVKPVSPIHHDCICPDVRPWAHGDQVHLA